MVKLNEIEFLPIDLPKVPIPPGLAWERNGEEWRWWNFTRLTEKNKNYAESKWIYLPEWEWIKNWIVEHIPFTKIVQVKVNRQILPSESHIDFVNPMKNPDLYQHNKDIEPCGYRMVLTGRRDGLIVGENNTTYLPPETDVYCIRHTETWHRTLSDEGRMMVFIHAWMDKDRHYDIINRSIRKFEKYLVLRSVTKE